MRHWIKRIVYIKNGSSLSKWWKWFEIILRADVCKNRRNKNNILYKIIISKTIFLTWLRIMVHWIHFKRYFFHFKVLTVNVIANNWNLISIMIIFGGYINHNVPTRGNQVFRMYDNRADVEYRQNTLFRTHSFLIQSHGLR